MFTFTKSHLDGVSDPYAGLTFSTQNYTTDFNGNAWKWGPETGGGPGNNGEAMVRTYSPQNRQDVAVFQRSTQGAGVNPSEDGTFVIYDAESAGGTDRSEHSHRLALNWEDDLDALELPYDTWHALALPSTFVADVGSKAGTRCIVAQVHDTSNNPANLVLRDNGTATGLYVNYEEIDGSTQHYIEAIAPGTFSFGTEYQLVWAIYIDTGNSDKIRLYVDGVLVHDEDDGNAAGAFTNYSIFYRSAEYWKHGIYWTGQGGTDIDNMQHKVRISGFGMFAGPDAIAAALIRVQQ